MYLSIRWREEPQDSCITREFIQSFYLSPSLFKTLITDWGSRFSVDKNFR